MSSSYRTTYSNHSHTPNYVWLVINESIPTHSMYMDNSIEIVNASCVGVYSTQRAARLAARRYFFNELCLVDSGQSEIGGIHSVTPDNVDNRQTMFGMHVYVERQVIHSDNYSM